MPAMIGSGIAVILFHYSLGLILVAMLLVYLIIMGIFRLARRKSYTPLWVGVVALVILGTGMMAYYGNVAKGTPIRYVTALIPVKEQKLGFLTIGWLSHPENT